MDYWQKRLTDAYDRLLLQQFDEMNKLLREQYSKILLKMIAELEELYAIVLSEKNITNKTYVYQKYYKAVEQVEKELRKVTKVELDVLDDHLKETYIKAYELTGESLNFASMPFDPKELELALAEQWTSDGVRYSDRIWKNNSQLSQAIKDLMTEAIVEGKSNNQLTYELLEKGLLNDVSNDIKKAYFNANRIVNTELAHIRNMATLDWNIANGFTQVSVFTAEDEKVCDTCNQLDGKVFDVLEERKNPHLPAHPNCRCCYLTVLNKEGA